MYRGYFKLILVKNKMLLLCVVICRILTATLNEDFLHYVKHMVLHLPTLRYDNWYFWFVVWTGRNIFYLPHH